MHYFYVAHEKDDPISVVAPYYHSTSPDIPAILHSVTLPIRLHIMPLSPFYPVVTYTNFASKYQRMPQCHTPVLIY